MQDYQVLLDVVRQNFASVVWTHKIQEKQADIYSQRYKQLETINIIVAALTSCGVVSLVSNQECILLKIVTCILSFATLSITAYFKSFDLKSLEKQHKDAANHFIVIRNDLLQVIADIHMKNGSVQDINERYQEIMKRLNSLYITAPGTSDDAVNRASMALGKNKEYSYKDEEIDCFLPSGLRGKLK